MLSPTDRETLNRGRRVSVGVWWAMAASVGIYILICHIGEADLHGAADLGDVLSFVRSLLLGIGALTLLATPYITRLALRLPLAGGGGPMEPGSAHARAALARQMTSMIIGLALSDSVAIYGLVLFMLGDSFGTLYAFSAGALIGMWFHYPGEEALERLARELRLREHSAKH